VAEPRRRDRVGAGNGCVELTAVPTINGSAIRVSYAYELANRLTGVSDNGPANAAGRATVRAQ
jgi:hypothetical protein